MAQTLTGYLVKKANVEILRYLAEHPRPIGKATSVNGLHNSLTKAGLRVERSDVINVLKAAAQEGAGKFYVGRHGRKSRIIWTTDRSVLAKRILTERGEVSNKPGTATAPAPDPARGEEEEDAVGMLRYPFMLRNRLEITLELPTDLTMQEATRLSDFIKTLPLG